jgi:plastocyanin
MRVISRWYRALLMAAVVVASALALQMRAGMPAAGAYQPHVTIYDNDAKLQPGQVPFTALWGFAPHQLVVTRGEKIVFENPTSNVLPHSVTSITWSGDGEERVLRSGARFNSSPTVETLLRPGDTFTLDTTDLAPGHYLFYCWPHPWMMGSFFVMRES